jgi:hypothetical protein
MDPRRISKMLNLDRIKPMLSKTQIKTHGFVQMNCDGAGLYIHVHCTGNAHIIIITHLLIGTACKIPEIIIFSSILVNRKIRTVRDVCRGSLFCPNTLLTKPM